MNTFLLRGYIIKSVKVYSQKSIYNNYYVILMLLHTIYLSTIVNILAYIMTQQLINLLVY